MREGQLTDLSKAANGIIIGEALAEKLAVKNGNTVLLGGRSGSSDFGHGGRNLPVGIETGRRRTDLFPDQPGPDPDGAKRDHQSVAAAV